jgi:hypothetical protein
MRSSRLLGGRARKFGLLELDEVAIVVANWGEDVEVQGDLVADRLRIMRYVRRYPHHGSWPCLDRFIAHVKTHTSFEYQDELFERVAVRTDLHPRLKPVQDADHILPAKPDTLDAGTDGFAL